MPSPAQQEVKGYQHQLIEQKWKGIWERIKLFHDIEKDEDFPELTQEDLYILFAFAYPSGSGLHVGHVESLTALDILVRYQRMQGKTVLFPPGWDSFGLPAENYAIKNGVHPAVITNEAIGTFQRQVRDVGISYNWDREIATHEPEYYRWTQWFFQQLYESGLAYRDFGSVNWCPKDQTVLANEQVKEGCCERCGTSVVQKDMLQWYLRISAFQDELIDDLKQVDWPASTAKQQVDWIGRQDGSQVRFEIPGTGIDLACFTTRLDTVFGVSFVAMAPEKLSQLGLMDAVDSAHREIVLDYVKKTQGKTEEQRKKGEKEKSGVDTGLKVINPVNGEEVPVFIADYVLANYGTGVVMGVPAHDKRDYQFAQKYGLEIREVIVGEQEETESELFEDKGTLVNSGEFTGMTSEEAVQAIQDQFAGQIEAKTVYRLRDWLVSRQRYWGAPIPIVYDPEGNPHLVKEEHLPWMLPNDVDFTPGGESPLASSEEFIRRTEELYGEGWRPEFDTLDTFVDSSWYFMRFTDPHNPNEIASREALDRHMPVDFYMIGAEHTVLHLLYSRFFTKFAKQKGWVSVDEPFQVMRHQGTILGTDGTRMAKSKGNVINPDKVVESHGADSLRLYEMFMGPIEAEKAWQTQAISGPYRFLSRIFDLYSANSFDENGVDTGDDALRRQLHRTIKKVGGDIEALKYNTAISAMIELTNTWVAQQASIEDSRSILTLDEAVDFLKILAPFAPFITSELYALLVATDDNPEPIIHQERWPSYDPELTAVEHFTIPIQIDGKVRGDIIVSADDIHDEEKIMELIWGSEQLRARLEQLEIDSYRSVPGKIVSFSTKRSKKK